MSKWIGYAVSVNCGDPLGCYQGTILEADGNTITLIRPFRNGFPYPRQQVTLNAADIKDLKIIEEAKSEPSEHTHSTVAVSKNNKKGPRATVCENLQANSSTSDSQQNGTTSNGKTQTSRSSGQVPARSKPIDIQTNKNKNNNLNNNNQHHSGSYNNMSSTPKQRGERARRRNEACFGDGADPALQRDFDFEGNLALFDKQALWKEMRAGGARPDVVRAADEATRLRHDENVLGAAPPAAAIRLPRDLRGAARYCADDGRRVPAASPRARQLLWAALRRHGLLDAARPLAARAAADLALRLAGGGRRLEARNAHQAPVAVVLAAAHGAGASGVATARLLRAHGVKAHVLLSGAGGAGGGDALRTELAALALDGAAPHASTSTLPAPDVVVVALYDPLLDDAQEAHAEALRWARAARAAVLALEPPATGWEGLNVRASLVGGLPPALAPSLGRVFLANIAVPMKVFQELKITYRPPFGACSVLALNDEGSASPSGDDDKTN